MRADYSWYPESTSCGSIKKMKHDTNIYENAIFPLHDHLRLLDIKSEKTEMLRKHVKELYKIVKV